MIPTVADVVAEIQSLLGDPGGRVFDQALAERGYKRAYQYLRSAMLKDGVQHVIGVITYTLPAGVKQLSPATAGITNSFGELIELSERTAGSTEAWVPMAEQELLNGAPGSSLGVFEWRADGFWFHGATGDRQLLIRYYDSGAEPPPSGPVGIDGSLPFLSYYGATSIGPSRGYDDAEIQRMRVIALGPRLDGSGGMLYDLLQPMVRASHRVQRSQPPYLAGGAVAYNRRKLVVTNYPSPAPGPWQTPVYQNGWINTPGFAPLRYRLTSSGSLEIVGSVYSGTPETVVFTLPPGYRPVTQRGFAVGADVATSAIFAPYVRIETNGNVILSGVSPITASYICAIVALD